MCAGRRAGMSAIRDRALGRQTRDRRTWLHGMSYEGYSDIKLSDVVYLVNPFPAPGIGENASDPSVASPGPLTGPRTPFITSPGLFQLHFP